MIAPKASTNVASRMLRPRFAWLEEFDRIAVGIFQLNLSPARPHFHLIAKRDAGVLQRLDLCREISHTQDDSIPAAGLLGLAARQRTRSRRSRPAEQQRE